MNPGDAGWDGLGISRNLGLDLSGTKTNDADLDRLRLLPAFRSVHYLSLKGSSITDAGLARLRNHPGELRLRHVDMTDTAVSPQRALDLANIKSHPFVVYGPSQFPKTNR